MLGSNPIIHIATILAQAQASSKESSFFWGGAFMGAVFGGLIGYFLNNLRGETKVKAAMVDLERERLNRQTELEREQAKRGGSMDEHHLVRLKNEAELSSINIEIAKYELADRKAASSETGVSSGQLHKLQAAKFEREIAMLDAQVELSRRDLAMRGDQLDFHDTRMEQSKLEIESLKLQIREQKKRLDEFGHGE